MKGLLTQQRDLTASMIADACLCFVKGATVAEVDGNQFVLTVRGIKYTVVVSVKRHQDIGESNER